MFETQSSNLSTWEWLGKYRLTIILLASVVITPIALFFGLGTAIEGDFTYTKMIFPYMVLSIVLLREVLVLLGINISAFMGAFPEIFYVLYFPISLLQFPIYGMIVSLAEKERLVIRVAEIILVHLVFVIVAFVGGYLLRV